MTWGFRSTQLGWWFGELSALFMLAAIVIGLIAGYRDQELVDTFVQGARDFLTPALIIAVARGVTVIMKNGLITDTVLNSLEGLVAGTGSVAFANLMYIINLPSGVPDPVQFGSCDAGYADPGSAGRFREITALDRGHRVPVSVRLAQPDYTHLGDHHGCAGGGAYRLRSLVPLRLALLLLIILVATMLLLSLAAFGLGK